MDSGLITSYIQNYYYLEINNESSQIQLGPVTNMTRLRPSLMKNSDWMTEYTPNFRHRLKKYRLLIWGATNERPGEMMRAYYPHTKSTI